MTPLTGPVIENKVNGRFITESPLKLLREGHFNKVPLITGVNSDEGVLVAQGK